MTPLERFLAAAGAAVMSVGTPAPGHLHPPARPAEPSIMAEVTAPLPRSNPLRVDLARDEPAPAAAAVREASPADDASAGADTPAAKEPRAAAVETVETAPAPDPLSHAGIAVPAAGQLGPPQDIADLILHADDAGEGLSLRFADALPEVSPAFAPDGPMDPAAADAPAAVARAEEAPAEAAIADAPPEVAIPLPRRRPAVTLSRRARPEAAEVQVARLTPGDGLPQPDRRAPASDLACMTALASLGIAAERLPTIRQGACGVEAPLDLGTIGRGAEAVSFAPQTVINCGVAGALAEWLRDDVQPAARSAFGQRVTGIRVAASYACRGRNNNPRARLSEHAFGNAIDIAAFELADGTLVEVEPRPSPREARFLGAVRQEACGPFTTVLGPGVAQHDTHFHLDLARRGRSGRSLYCR